MIMINALLLLFFLSFFLITYPSHKEWLKGINKKEHKLYFIYPMAEVLLNKTGLYKILCKKVAVHEAINALKVTNKPEEHQKFYWYNKISNVIVILILFSVLSILGELNAKQDILKDGRYLARPDYSEDNKEIELEVMLEEQGEAHTEKESSSQKLSIKVENRKYSKEELLQCFADAQAYLKEQVLGENISYDSVVCNLNFCDTIPETGITVKWKPEDYDLIHSDGTVLNEELKERVTSKVTAILLYEEESLEVPFTFQILPKEYGEEEQTQRKLQEELIIASEQTATLEWFELPKVLGNSKVYWSSPKNHIGTILLLLGMVLALAAWLLGDKELDQQMKKRKDQLLLDYPELVNKFVLLVNAGMTIKQAWYRIAENYSYSPIPEVPVEHRLTISYQKKDKHKHEDKQQDKHRYKNHNKNQDKKHYAYEEMLITVNELKLGASESTAYENYGRRVGVLPYIRFCSLVTQNLKKGNKGFTELLKQEAIIAFEERKEIAKRLGEEAGTKLLIPMMLILIIVFMIILIPAFISFRV